MKNKKYSINMMRTTYLKSRNISSGITETYCSICYFDKLDEAMEKLKKLPLKFKFYLDDLNDEEQEELGIVCIEYEITEEFGNYELIEEKTIKNFGIDEEFLKKLFQKVDEKNVIYHDWIENPTIEQILKLQNIQNLD